jgi:hypothetical protein
MKVVIFTLVLFQIMTIHARQLADDDDGDDSANVIIDGADTDSLSDG